MSVRSISLAALIAISGLWQQPIARADNPILGPNDGVVEFQSTSLRRLGFTANVQVEKHLSPGYFAARIVVTGIGAAPADQRLTFRFVTDPGGETPPGNGLVIDVPVTIAQGSRTAAFTRYLPKWSVGQSLQVSIWQDGNILEDSKLQIGGLQKLPPLQSRTTTTVGTATVNLMEAGFVRECRQDWLLIANPEQDTSEASSLIERVVLENAQPVETTGDPIDATEAIDKSRTFYRTNLNSLPTDWRGYQSYDVAVMNAATCRQIAQNSTALRALRNWILQGGTVIVYDGRSIQETLQTLEFGAAESSSNEQTLASLDSQATSPRKASPGFAGFLYDQLRKAGDSGTAAGLFGSAKLSKPLANDGETAKKELAGAPTAQSPVAQSPVAKSPAAQSPVAQSEESSAEYVGKSAQEIRFQPVGAGLVFSILSSANTVSGIDGIPTPLHWRLIKERLEHRSSTILREGTEPLLGNRRFRQWSVPNVRQPPVYSFMGLLTVFVILVGPVAYRQTSKYGRSHLMFAIAPILAIFTTLAMLGYGIVSDGFRTKVRIRQLTWVDGKSGDAGERVRATYFAGIRPSGGLRFPSNATVMRQAESDGSTWEESNQLPPATLGRITIRDDAQIFGTSFLPSRVQKQFVFHAPREQVGSVRLLLPKGGRGQPRLANGLSFPLQIVIVRDANGEYWGTRFIDAAETKLGIRLDSRSASSWLGKLHSDYRPMATTDENQSQTRREVKIIDPLGAIAKQLQMHPRFEDGLFEDWLRSHLQLQGEIPKEHFVAMAAVSDDVIAVEVSEILDSVRYVFGTLP